MGALPTDTGELIVGKSNGQEDRTAIVCVSRKGAHLAERLRGLVEEGDLFVPARFAAEAPSASHLYEGRVATIIERVFPNCSALIAIMSLGVAVRLVAPYLKDKHSDPALVVVDDTGRFAISALSGHLGGANALASRIADLIGAEAVITTASDLAGTIQVDLLGKAFGWKVESFDAVTAVSAAVVNGEQVGIFLDAGETEWWPPDENLPDNITVFSSLVALSKAELLGALVVTDRLLADSDLLGKVPTVVYRPKTLVLGVGCNRGTSATEIEQAVTEVLERYRLAPKSVRNLASIDVKSDEQGLLEYAAQSGLPIQFFSATQLATITDLPNPSDAALAAVGVRGVSEPAAMMSAGNSELIVAKQKFGNVTVAIARVEFERRSNR